MSAAEEANDFVITVHALDRMTERFPEFVEGLDDGEIGELIHREVVDAIDAGRRAKTLPVGFAPLGRWRRLAQRKGGFVVWTEDSRRAYVLHFSDEMYVLTVLTGL